MRRVTCPSTFILSMLAAALLLGVPAPAVAQDFGVPAPLNSNADTDSGGDYKPQITTDGAGNWVAVWYSNDGLGGTIGPDVDILVARSTDNGATWTAPAALNTNAAADSGEDYDPQLATDGAGNWTAIWVSNDTLGGTVGPDNDILVARSTDNGATWTAPAALNSDAAADSRGDYRPQVTTDGAGNWLATWHSFSDPAGPLGTDNDILVARSTDNCATWSLPAALNTNAAADSGSDVYPQIATDGAGNWVAVWRSENDLDGTIGTDADILLARSTDNGVTWTSPAALNTNAATDSGHDREPQLTTDGAGNWVATWSSYDDLGGTIGTDADILVARSTDNGVTWTAPVPLNTNAAIDYPPVGFPGGDYAVQVTTDRLGNWVATWEATAGLGGTIGNDYDIVFSRSTDNGATWTPPEALNPNAAFDTAHDWFAEVTTDGAGNWVVTWTSDDSLGETIGTEGDILIALDSLCGRDPLEPASCLVAPSTKLQLTNSADPGRDKLAWQWSKGDAFDQLDLGAPLVEDGYELCVYDTNASVPELVATIEVESSPTLWTSKDPKGFYYRDREGTADGITRLQLKTGEATRTRVKLSAKGTNLRLPAPVGTKYFAQSPNVVAQLVNSDGACWTSEFDLFDNTRNDATSFKAQTK